jgi:hypothetical protein
MGIAVTGAANNGSGLVRLTVGPTAAWTTGQRLTVNSIVGTTEANSPTPWVITVIDGTHIDLQGSTFTNAYVSGGRASDTSMMFTGLALLQFRRCRSSFCGDWRLSRARHYHGDESHPDYFRHGQRDS